MKKKILCSVLALSLAMAFAGCSETEAEETEAAEVVETRAEETEAEETEAEETEESEETEVTETSETAEETEETEAEESEKEDETTSGDVDAVAVVDEFMTLLAAGDTDGAAELTTGSTELSEYSSDTEGVTDHMSDVIHEYFATYYSRVDYELTDNGNGEVSINGTCPNPEMIQELMYDDDLQVDIIAGTLDAMYFHPGEDDYETLEILTDVMYLPLIDIIESVPTDGTYSQTLTVNSDGLIEFDEEEFLEDVSFEIVNENASSDVTIAAFDKLLEEGKISEEDYESWMSMMG